MKARIRVIACKNTTSHYVGGELAAQPTLLEINQDGNLFFLFRLNENEESIADTCHTSLDEAKSQAEFEYILSPDGWEVIIDQR